MIRRSLRLNKVGTALDSTAAVRLVAAYRKGGSVKRFRVVATKDGAKRVAWTPRPGYVYSQVRAISARVNQNYDAWPSKELKKAYHSFVGKPIFVNHTNEDWKTARGVVVAARYVEKGADKYIECVMETDAKRFPKLAREIVKGGMDSVSMGVEAGFTICSVCENRATDVGDMCHHVRDHKGEYFKSRKTGKRVQAYEDCYKLGFFELSWVFDPADETAVASRVIAAGKVAQDFSPIGWDRWQPTEHETLTRWSPQSEAYQDHQPPNMIMRGKDPEMANAFDHFSDDEKRQADPLGFMEPYAVPKQDYQVRERDQPRNRTSLRAASRRNQKGVGDFENYWLRWNETKIANEESFLGHTPDHKIPEYLEHLRGKVRNQNISMGELSDLQGLAGAGYIHPDDMELHEAAGTSEEDFMRGQDRNWDNDPFDPREFGASRKARRQPLGELGAMDHLAASGREGGGPDRLGGRAPQGRGARGPWHVADRWTDTKAPEDIDTLRDESEDDTDDFHHWVESPPELRAPDIDQAKQLDREQESDGLDGDRRAEDAEELAGSSQPNPENPVSFRDDPHEQDPVMPINPPETKKGRRTPNQGAPMPRYRHAADDDDYTSDDDGADDGYDDGGSDDGYDDGSDDSGFGGQDDGSDDGSGDDGGGDDIDDLLDEAEADIDAYQNGGGDDFCDDGSYDDGSCDDGGDFDPDGDGDDDSSFGGDDDGDHAEDDGFDGGAPPWAGKDARARGPVRNARSRGNSRGGSMPRQTLASRNPMGRHFTADDGHTDGGPYGVDDSQGAQEDVFISQVPGAEPVCAPTDDASNISNTPNNLVASRPQFDPNHYQKLADAVAALPPAQRRAMADKMVRMLTADNKRFNWRTFFEASRVPVVKKGNRYFYAEDLTDPDKVDPSLSGTDVQDLKGDDFESLALDNVETQPKDASIHAFRAFDAWLHQATGRTAAQHGNANYIRRAAAAYVTRTGARLEALFPTLEYVLAEARKVEGRKANMYRRAEDESLNVAAPDGRIDVEAPVKNVTDADAQASQFDLKDFADNASDSKADPVLDPVDGNAGTWAPDKGKDASRKLASGVEAVRLADAYIRAYPNTYSENDRWKLTARFETLRQPVVRDRIRVLEAVAEDRGKSEHTARKVAAASSRGTNGIPKGLASRGRTAATRKASATDPATDYGLFI